MEQLDKKSTSDRVIIDLESMGYQCLKVIGMYNYLEIKDSLEMHRHDNMLEICFLEKGFQYYYIDNEDYYIEGGDIIITFPGELHGTLSYPEEKGRLFWLIITIPEANQTLLNLSQKESDVLIRELLSLKSIRKFKAAHHIKSDLSNIMRIYNEKESILKRIRITNLILSFLLKVLQYGKNKIEVSVSKEILDIKTFIDNNLYEELFLDKLAYHANLSLSHFKFRFKKELGYSPGDYILRKRIERAKILLLLSKNVSDVACTLMFSSPAYFATVFKRFTGMSPTNFKEMKKM